MTLFIMVLVMLSLAGFLDKAGSAVAPMILIIGTPVSLTFAMVAAVRTTIQENPDTR
jgi:hypothetical protein